MKNTTKLLLALVLTLISAESRSQDWNGNYSYFKQTPPAYYSLTITDSSCVYVASGQQLLFHEQCRGERKGDNYLIYHVKTLDGLFIENIDTTKPIFILYYQDKELYTIDVLFNNSIPEVKFVKSEEEKRDLNNEVIQIAQFPNGEDEMMRFIQQHLDYPDIAREKEIQGRVIVKFDVESNGTLSDIHVVKSIDKLLDDEALRVVGLFPRFTPKKVNGVPVKSSFVVPINFRIN